MKQTFRIAIVEDEPAIARGLESIIRSNSLDFDIVGICRNGLEGLELIKKERPQIVFTDIRMPVMDGLSMIEAAREVNPAPFFVIITGFADFPYAQTAIKLNVSDYLLKPVDPDQVIELLDKFRKITINKIHELQYEQIRSLIYTNTGKIGRSHLFDGYSVLFLCLFYGVIVDNTFDRLRIGVRQELLLDRQKLSPLENDFDISIYPYKGKHPDEYIYALVFPTNSVIDLNRFLLLFERQLPECELYHSLVVSSTAKTTDRLLPVLTDCYLYSIMHVPFGTNKMLYSLPLTKDKLFQVSAEIKELTKELPSSPSSSVIRSVCAKMIFIWKEKEVSQYQLVKEIKYIMNQSIQKSACTLPCLLDEVEIITEAVTYDALLDNMVETLNLIFDVSTEPMKKTVDDLVHNVKQYLDRNFTQNITSKMFFSLFDYNEKYISIRFKAKYGLTPSKYMGNLRLQYAKSLIKNFPGMSLKEVAEMAGFSDALYFSRVFKSIEGISPSTYQTSVHEIKE